MLGLNWGRTWNKRAIFLLLWWFFPLCEFSLLIYLHFRVFLSFREFSHQEQGEIPKFPLCVGSFSFISADLSDSANFFSEKMYLFVKKVSHQEKGWIFLKKWEFSKMNIETASCNENSRKALEKEEKGFTSHKKSCNGVKSCKMAEKGNFSSLTVIPQG